MDDRGDEGALSRKERRRAKNARRRERRGRRERSRRWERWLGAIDFEYIVLSEDWSYRALVRKYGRAGAKWRISVIVIWIVGVFAVLLTLLYRWAF